MTSPPIGTDEELIERLRRMAKSSSEAQRMIAEAKTARQTDREDSWTDAGYSWPAPEQTYEWKAADALQSRIAEVERLTALVAEMDKQVDDCCGCLGHVEPEFRARIDATLSQHRTRDE